MPERRYTKATTSGGGMPSGPPRGQQRREGVIAVAAKRPMEEPVARSSDTLRHATPNGEPAYGLEDMAIEREEVMRRLNRARSPQCSCCGRGEDVDVLVKAPGPEPAHKICGTCVEALVDTLRAELPRRRLRLAMERMMAGPIDAATVEAVEKMAGGGGG